MRFIEARTKSAVLRTALESLTSEGIRMFMKRFGSSLLLLWIPLNFASDTSVSDLDLHSKSQGCEKTKTYAVVFTKFSIDLHDIWYTVETFWFDEAHIPFITPDQCFKGRNPNYMTSKKNTPFHVDLHSDIYIWNSV